MIKTVILGNGNLGTHLCQIFEKNENILLLQNYNRKGKSIPNCKVPVTSEITAIANADIYIVAFDDSTLYELSAFEDLSGLVVHTSGATPISVLENFTNRGVFYPVQSFKTGVAVDFSEIPIVIEANSVLSEKLLTHLAKAISKHVYRVTSKQREALHLAAVFANNFSTFMYTQAFDICKQNELDFSILKPLIFDVVNKLQNNPPNKLQTGPAIRNDAPTINKHIDLLTNTSQQKLYTQLTKSIQNYYGKKL